MASNWYLFLQKRKQVKQICKEIRVSFPELSKESNTALLKRISLIYDMTRIDIHQQGDDAIKNQCTITIKTSYKFDFNAKG